MAAMTEHSGKKDSGIQPTAVIVAPERRRACVTEYTLGLEKAGWRVVAGNRLEDLPAQADIVIIDFETAAENPTLEALAVPFPDKAIRIISELSEELEKRRERGE